MLVNFYDVQRQNYPLLIVLQKMIVYHYILNVDIFHAAY